MTPGELLSLSWGALRAHKLRTRMTWGAISIGVASVIILTSLGEGAREWIVSRFAALGSNVLIVLPGRTETKGGAPMAPSTTRDLTLDDMEAVRRQLPGAQHVAPIVIGEAPAMWEGRTRATMIVGTTPEFLRLRDVRVAQGADLPDLDAEQGMRVCVLGATVRKELFRDANPLGQRLRVGEETYRVIGLLAPEGQSQMTNLDEMVLVPVADGLRLFNRTSLFRIVVRVTATADLELAQRRLTAILKERHDGEEDFTILTPGAVGESLGAIVGIITAALAGIAAISLAVAGIGVMNVMVVSVTERTAEIGLMKAVGASNRQVLSLFLAEAVALSLFGGLMGVAFGALLTLVARLLYPAIPFFVPGWAVALGLSVAAGVGLVFGIAPAMRAARLEPLESLRRSV